MRPGGAADFPVADCLIAVLKPRWRIALRLRLVGRGEGGRGLALAACEGQGSPSSSKRCGHMGKQTLQHGSSCLTHQSHDSFNPFPPWA